MFPTTTGPGVSSSSGMSGNSMGMGVRRSVPHAAAFRFSEIGLSPQQAAQIWNSLRKAVEAILQGNNSQLRFEELYRNAYTLVLHKHGDTLYAGVEECVRERLKFVESTVANAPQEQLLDRLVSAWDDHKLKMTMLKDILMYMDKTYCKVAGVPCIYEKGLTLFKDHIIRSTGILPRFKYLMFESVRNERVGEVIDGMLLKNACIMLLEVNLNSLDLYQKEFEKELLSQTQTFFAAESQSFLQNSTVSDYLRKAEARLLEEEARADRYFEKSTKNKLRSILHEELLSNHAKRIVSDASTGAVFLLKTHAIEDMARMYSLFIRVPQCMELIHQALFELIKSSGTTIVVDKENQKVPRLFVEKVLELRLHYMSFLDKSFKQDRAFAKVMKEALEYFLNLDTRAAQFLSLYIDDLLRKHGGHGSIASTAISAATSAAAASSSSVASSSSSSTTNSSASSSVAPSSSSSGIIRTDFELDSHLSECMAIFRYLQDKDIFEDFYKQNLSRRLLESTSSSTESEKMMIAKLKSECGHQFTSRLEGMFRDMELSKQISKDWQENQRTTAVMAASQHTSLNQPELSVSVLTTGFWPLPTVPACILPPEAISLTNSFRDFYVSQHSGRKLTWQTQLGSAELKCAFEGGKKELVVHTYQMCILMLFNHGDKLSFAEIQTRTRIPADELTRHLLSLAHPQVKVLLKNPPGKACAPDHRFKYNTKFTSKLYRNRIALLSKAAAGVGPQPGEGAHANSMNTDDNISSGASITTAGGSSLTSEGGVPASVLESRKYSVEASIVRIMKTRKTLEHSLLVSEVVRQLGTKFPVEPAFIKKRIEALIEREYLERDPNNRRMYNYKA